MAADMAGLWQKPRVSGAVLVCTAALLLAAGAARSQTPPALLTPSQMAAQNRDEDAKFAAFVASFRQTALDAGITAATYDKAMSGIARNPPVSALNLQPPEFSRPVWEYLDSAVSPDRVTQGQTMLAQYSGPLATIEQHFQVPKEILVAIWGMESNYGEAMGSFNMFE